MRVLKFIIGGLFIIASLGMITQKEVLTGVISIILGAIILPPVSEKIKEKFNQWNSRGIRYIAYVVLLALVGITSKKTNFLSSNSITKEKSTEDVSSQNPYQNYLDESAKNIASLSPERKASREKLLSDLKFNPVYTKLVTEKVVNAEYLPVLNAITNGITNISDKSYAIVDNIAEQVTKSEDGDNKMQFVAKFVALAMPSANGGLPKEIIDVFERYKEKFGTSGAKGMSIDANMNSQQIKYDYDLTPFFVLMNPNSEENLEAVYEAKNKGLSSWNEKGNYTYPYIATKEGFLAKLKQIDPESKLFPKVDMEVTASELYRAYEANEVSADQQYKGKRLLITGVVENIGKDVMDNPYVALKIDFLKGVNCYFDDKNNKILSQLNKGQKIQIIGTCAGLTLTDVVVKDCELWE